LSFNVNAISALIPSIAASFSVLPFVAGRAIWLYMFPYGVFALFYGPLARVFDIKKIKLFCLFLFSLSNLFAGLARNIHTFFIARFFMGVFGASVIPLVLILIAQSNKEKRGKFVGLFFSITFMASLLGLFLSGILHWRLIFLIPGILGFMLWLHMYFYLPSFKQDTSGLKVNYLSAFENKAVLSIFTYIFFISLFYHAIQQWLGVYFSQKFQYRQFLISMLILSSSLSGVFGEAIGGWLSDVWGRFKTIEWGIILMIVSVFLLILKAPLIILALIMFIWGLGWTFNHAGLSTMLTDLPKEFLNESASLNSSVRFLSGGLGAALGGVLMQKSLYLNFLVFGLSLIFLSIFARYLLRDGSLAKAEVSPQRNTL